MKEVAPDILIEEAKTLAGRGVRWHFHLLLKNCAFSQKQGRYAMVLENEETGGTLMARFAQNPAGEAKRMAGLSFGADFMDKKEQGEHRPEFEAMFKMAEEMDRKRVRWHHHLFPPNCAFNGRKGKYVIVLEDEEGRVPASIEYASEPMGDMARLEKLFYKEVK